MKLSLALLLFAALSPPLAAPRPAPVMGEHVEGPSPTPPPSRERWLPAPPAKPPRRGIGLITVGTTSIGLIGAPLVVTAIVGFVENTRCEQAGGGSNCFSGLIASIMMPIGVIAIAAGAPMLAVGISRLRAYKKWQREHAVALHLHFGRSRGAWLPGLDLRF